LGGWLWHGGGSFFGDRVRTLRAAAAKARQAAVNGAAFTEFPFAAEAAFTPPDGKWFPQFFPPR